MDFVAKICSALIPLSRALFANFEIFMVDAKGKHEPVRVTNTDGFDGLPVFSPDGRQLMWTSKRGGLEGAQVFLADFVGLSPTGELIGQAGVKRAEN